jgi:hypothetical protein
MAVAVEDILDPAVQSAEDIYQLIQESLSGKNEVFVQQKF